MGALRGDPPELEPEPLEPHAVTVTVTGYRTDPSAGHLALATQWGGLVIRGGFLLHCLSRTVHSRGGKAGMWDMSGPECVRGLWAGDV